MISPSGAASTWTGRVIAHVAYRPSSAIAPLTDTYAPFDTIDDPARLSLTAESAMTDFGRLAYVRTARKSSLVNVFLHGVGSTWTTWTPLLQAAIAADAPLGDLLLFDLPGFGQSENKLARLDINTVGATVASVAARLGWEKMTLVGHSMGGFLALAMAAQDLPGVEAVRVISGAYFSIIDTVRSPWRGLLVQWNTAITYLALASLAKSGRTGVTALNLVDKLGLAPLALRRFFAHPTALPPGIVTSLLGSAAPASFLLAARNGRSYDPFARWSRISVPVRATFGAADHLVPPIDMERLRGTLPTCDCTCLDGVGHFGHIERPVATLQYLFDGSV